MHIHTVALTALTLVVSSAALAIPVSNMDCEFTYQAALPVLS